MIVGGAEQIKYQLISIYYFRNKVLKEKLKKFPNLNIIDQVLKLFALTTIQRYIKRKVKYNKIYTLNNLICEFFLISLITYLYYCNINISKLKNIYKNIYYNN